MIFIMLGRLFNASGEVGKWVSKYITDLFMW
jgi:hypothetical protein